LAEHRTLLAALRAEKLDSSLPPALPLAHLTAARFFAPLLVDGALKPRQCKVFHRDLLYFSYGGVFYRPRQIQTQNAVELPVAFVFSPRVLESVTRLFPFDSGAMGSGAFGDEWTARMAPFHERFGVDTSDAIETAGKIIYHLYGSNESYLRGQVLKAAKTKSEPIPLLSEFLSENLSGSGIDHRQRSVECVTETIVELGRHLIWVGFPVYSRRKTTEILKQIYHWTRPDVPQIWQYPYPKNFNPAGLGAALETKAHESVIARFAAVKA